MATRTAYATTSTGTHVAYQVFGRDGPDLVLVWGFLSHVELAWEHPGLSGFLLRLAEFARVVNFDKRGMGLSDPVPAPPTLEERSDDLQAVLDAVGSDRAYLFGMSEGVPACLHFAATHPERLAGLVLYGGMARSTESDDHPWAAPAEVLRSASRELIVPSWGDGAILEVFAPSVADDPEARAWQARIERHAAPPGVLRDLFELFLDIDVRDLVPSVHVPTLLLHRTGDRAVNVRASRWLAANLPDAELVELAGIDHQVWAGDTRPLLERIERFVTGSQPAPRYDRVLRTVLFTDICDSTTRAFELGDQAWGELVDRHDAVVREELDRHGGREEKTLGDGFLATFDGPARALHCAADVLRRTEGLGLRLRAGIHTGECELRDDGIGGIAVHIAARVADVAGPGEVLATDAVRTLVIGSGITFEERGSHELRGVPGRWLLVAPVPMPPA